MTRLAFSSYEAMKTVNLINLLAFYGQFGRFIFYCQFTTNLLMSYTRDGQAFRTQNKFSKKIFSKPFKIFPSSKWKFLISFSTLYLIIAFTCFKLFFMMPGKERKDLFSRNILFCCSISNLWNAFNVVSENIPLLNTFQHAISHKTCLGRRDKCECWNVFGGVHQNSCWMNSRRIRTKSTWGIF